MIVLVRSDIGSRRKIEGKVALVWGGKCSKVASDADRGRPRSFPKHRSVAKGKRRMRLTPVAPMPSWTMTSTGASCWAPLVAFCASSFRAPQRPAGRPGGPAVRAHERARGSGIASVARPLRLLRASSGSAPRWSGRAPRRRGPRPQTPRR